MSRNLFRYQSFHFSWAQLSIRWLWIWFSLRKKLFIWTSLTSASSFITSLKRNWCSKLGNFNDCEWHNYRPGQPNWEYMMWRFQDISATQIFREINCGHIKAPKTALLTIWAALKFEFLESFAIFKCDIFLKINDERIQNCWNGNVWPSEISQNWFHVKS